MYVLSCLPQNLFMYLRVVCTACSFNLILYCFNFMNVTCKKMYLLRVNKGPSILCIMSAHVFLCN